MPETQYASALDGCHHSIISKGQLAGHWSGPGKATLRHQVWQEVLKLLTTTLGRASSLHVSVFQSDVFYAAIIMAPGGRYLVHDKKSSS